MVDLKSKFKKPAGNAAKSSGKAAPRGRKSRYAGLKASAGRTPRLAEGSYMLRIRRHEEGNNPGKGTDSFKAYWEIVQCDERAAENGAREGALAFESWRTSGAGSQVQLERLAAYVMAASGYDDQDDFDAFAGVEGELFDAALGDENAYSVEGGDPLAERLIFVEVTRGNETPQGDYYREYSWTPAVDECGRLEIDADGDVVTAEVEAAG